MRCAVCGMENSNDGFAFCPACGAQMSGQPYAAPQIGEQQLDQLGAAMFKATPHKDRLSALYASCLHLFRHIAQIYLEIR